MSAVLHRIIAFLEMSQIEREGTREKQRERGREQGESPNAFYDLVSESHCHFCLIPFVKKRVTRSRPDSKQWE